MSSPVGATPLPEYIEPPGSTRDAPGATITWTPGPEPTGLSTATDRTPDPARLKAILDATKPRDDAPPPIPMPTGTYGADPGYIPPKAGPPLITPAQPGEGPWEFAPQPPSSTWAEVREPPWNPLRPLEPYLPAIGLAAFVILATLLAIWITRPPKI